MINRDAIPTARYGVNGFSDANKRFSALVRQEPFKRALTRELDAMLAALPPTATASRSWKIWETSLLALEVDAENSCRVFLASLNDVIDLLDRADAERIFYDILEAMYDDCVIIGKDGTIEAVMASFDSLYDLPASQAVGHTVYEMEEQGIFNPSVAAMVLRTGKQETVLQMTRGKKYLMCTAIPVMDKKGKLQKVISYTRDVTKYESIREEYEKLKEMVSVYASELEQLRQEQNIPSHIINASSEMRKLIAQISRIAKFDSNVLITGESGVGKTMYAKLIHSQGARKDGPFIEINCGAIPENLLESELFGYEQGAFTGAHRDGKPGLVELADNGTLFLDEIGDLPLHMQVKLLKVIQEQRITRVGALQDRPVNFHLISATNRKLDEMVENGSFREDLFYRLNVIAIDVPPLREHKDDIFPLIMHFMEVFCKKHGIKRTISDKAVEILVAYDWPGNIRQLENVVERMLVSTDGYVINPEHIPPSVRGKKPSPGFEVKTNGTLKEMLESVERRIFRDCYKKYGSTTKVAKALGISQPSASMKLSKYLEKGN